VEIVTAGEGMLTEIPCWFRSRGIGKIELSVAAHNSIGNAFWRLLPCRLPRQVPYLGQYDPVHCQGSRTR